MASPAYYAIIQAAEEYLQKSNSTSPSSSRSHRDIVSAVRKSLKEKTLDIDVTDGTLLSYLSTAANSDPGSGIVSGGPHRGYWYSPAEKQPADVKPTEQEKIRPQKGKEVTVVEKDLYPLLELWLAQKGYASKDVSSLKSGGRWGNPDIVGVNRVELFGSVEIDLASCEVKLSDGNWEQVIFEAISHKRFTNRSWFCYRVPIDGQPMPKGMEYYAERYRIGVVQIILSDSELAELKSEKKKPIDFIDHVVERVPALFDFVPLKERSELVERTGVTVTVSF